MMDAAALARLLQVVAVATLNAGLALAVGASALLDRQRLGCTRLLRAGLALCGVGNLLLLWWQAATMGDVPLSQAGGQLLPVLQLSHFGHAWLAGMAALLVTALLTPLARHANVRPAQAALLLALAVFIAARSSVSHLGADGPAWAAAIDGLHLAAIATWAGAVFCGVALLRPAAALPAGDARPLVARLSTLATGALGAIVATGVLMAYESLGGAMPATLDSEYLRALAAKLVFVAIAAGLGACNRFAVMPSFMRPAAAGLDPRKGMSRFVAVLRVEAVVMLVILVLAALLATSAPPGAA